MVTLFTSSALYQQVRSQETENERSVRRPVETSGCLSSVPQREIGIQQCLVALNSESICAGWLPTKSLHVGEGLLGSVSNLIKERNVVRQDRNIATRKGACRARTRGSCIGTSSLTRR